MVDEHAHILCDLPASPLRLWEHLAIKLILNTLSTATMVRLGRVIGNAMVWVSPSNKKLIDRGCRLIAQQTGCTYEHACEVLHEAIEEIGRRRRERRGSPVTGRTGHRTNQRRSWGEDAVNDKHETRISTTPPEADACCPVSSGQCETSTNVQNAKFETGVNVQRQRFGPSRLGFVSDFEFRISNLPRHFVVFSFLCLCLSCRVEHAPDARWARIDAVVQAEIQAGHLPGAVVLVGDIHRVLYCKAFGLAVAEPFQTPMEKDTVFDLASLTKPTATAVAVMILVDRGKLDPNDRVGNYLPAFACNGKEDVRIRHLLTHTSGLPAYTDAKTLKDPSTAVPAPTRSSKRFCSLKAQSEPGQEFRYSCLGYITLARIVRTVTGPGHRRVQPSQCLHPSRDEEHSVQPAGRVAGENRRDGNRGGCVAAVRCTIRWPG